MTGSTAVSTSEAPARDARSGEPALVVQTSFLGDVVLTTPLIAELAQRGPVDVVVTPAAAPLLANNPSIRRLITYDKRRQERGLRGLHRTAARVRDGLHVEATAAPVAYIAQRSLRSAALARLAGCPVRVGFRRSPGGPLYTHRIAYRDDLHHAERLWRLAFREEQAPDSSAERIRPRLYPGAPEVAAVSALLAPLSGSPFVVLAPGSVWGTKRWPHYPQLAKRLIATHPVVVIGSPADAALAREIAVAGGTGRVVDATGRLSLLGSAELIGRAALTVTNDSSPLHLASAMGTPTVAIFGPTVPAFGFGPLSPRAAVAGHDSLPCRPCHKHGPQHCPLQHWRCMRELDAASIHRLADHIMSLP
jgi:heptosyltransferase II